MLFELIPEPWNSVLSPLKAEIEALGTQLQARANSGERILPDKRLVFRALEIPPDQVKVIVVGQDPYPNPADAIGLSFSVPPRVSGLPGSLMNIQKEILTDIGKTTTADGDLSRWSAQGVMLLNRVLTVTAGSSGSHSTIGWQSITRKIVETAAANGAIGLLWGNTARELAPIFGTESLVEGVHPSPLSAHRGFLGSRPFSSVNQLLRKKNQAEISW
jgi:uracil-DNA glycosylase